MRVLIHAINYAPELTGIGKYTGEMGEWLAGRGHEVRVLTAPPYYPAWRVGEGYRAGRYRREAIEGVDVLRCPLWVPPKPSGLKRIVHLLSFGISSLPPALWCGLRWRPDAVFVLQPPLACAPGAAAAGALGGAVRWMHVQDFEVDAAFDLGLVRSGLARRVVGAVERLLLGRFHRVSTISGRMRERLRAKGVAGGRVVSFPNWVDTAAIRPLGGTSPMRAELGIDEARAVALYSGNMGEKQGLEIVVEGARRLAHEADIQFLMCGQGSAHDRLRELAAGLENITWLPLQPLERLNDLLNLADIHLLPQRPNAADLVMPSKLTGMLASGRPVVATSAPGTEVHGVVEGRGINTPPGDGDAFADAVRALARDPRRRQALGAAARRYAETELDRDAVLERFEAELARAVDERRGGAQRA